MELASFDPRHVAHSSNLKTYLSRKVYGFFSSTDMANIVLLLVIIMLVFSVIGVTLFRDIVPMYFGNLSSCIFLFQYLIVILIIYELHHSLRKKEECFYFTLGNIPLLDLLFLRQALFLKLSQYIFVSHDQELT